MEPTTEAENKNKSPRPSNNIFLIVIISAIAAVVVVGGISIWWWSRVDEDKTVTSATTDTTDDAIDNTATADADVTALEAANGSWSSVDGEWTYTNTSLSGSDIVVAIPEIPTEASDTEWQSFIQTIEVVDDDSDGSLQFVVPNSDGADIVLLTLSVMSSDEWQSVAAESTGELQDTSKNEVSLVAQYNNSIVEGEDQGFGSDRLMVEIASVFSSGNITINFSE